MENSKQPAYPFEWEHCKDGKVYEFGLSKRELIAAMAMQGILANKGIEKDPTKGKEIRYSEYAQNAIMASDELLNQLENK